MAQQSVRRLGDENRHYWRAVKMARTTGADLQTALDAQVITHADWAAMVQRCRGCDWVGGCGCWMAAQAPDAVAPVPRACRNADMFDKVLNPA